MKLQTIFALLVVCVFSNVVQAQMNEATLTQVIAGIDANGDLHMEFEYTGYESRQHKFVVVCTPQTMGPPPMDLPIVTKNLYNTPTTYNAQTEMWEGDWEYDLDVPQAYQYVLVVKMYRKRFNGTWEYLTETDPCVIGG